MSVRHGIVEHMFDTTDWDLTADAEVAQLRTGVAELSCHLVDHWHGDALSERLVELLELRERLDAEVARTAAAWSR